MADLTSWAGLAAFLFLLVGLTFLPVFGNFKRPGTAIGQNDMNAWSDGAHNGHHLVIQPGGLGGADGECGGGGDGGC